MTSDLRDLEAEIELGNVTSPQFVFDRMRHLELDAWRKALSEFARVQTCVDKLAYTGLNPGLLMTPQFEAIDGALDRLRQFIEAQI